MTQRRAVAITSPDITSGGYSGMGMRALGIAGALSRHHRVSLLVDGVPSGLPATAARVISTDAARRRAVAEAEVVVTSNALRLRQQVGLRAAVVSDLYDPSYFEWLVLEQDERRQRRTWMHQQLAALRRAVRSSDVILCANSRQRDLYLGALLDGRAMSDLLDVGRIPVQDRVLVVPNGTSDGEELPGRREARERLGFHDEDVVLLWGGGVWDWLDAETVVRAVTAAHAENPRVRLVFLGLRRHDEPDPHASRAVELLSGYAGVANDGPVRVNERWVSSVQRLDYLAAADAGILGQYDNLETHFSFRTRVIDCLKAGLPLITMRGDELSERAAVEGWGLASDFGDVAGMRAQVLKLAGDLELLETMKDRARDTALQMSWEQVCQPLVDALNDLATPDRTERLRRTTRLGPSLVTSATRQLITRVSRDGR